MRSLPIVFVASANNFSFIAWVHEKMNMSIVGNTGHFDYDIDCAGSEGLAGMNITFSALAGETRELHPSCFQVHGTWLGDHCRLQADKNDSYIARRPHSLLEHTDYAACSQFCSAGLVWRPRVTKAAVRRVNCHFEHLSLDKHNSFADTLE